MAKAKRATTKSTKTAKKAKKRKVSPSRKVSPKRAAFLVAYSEKGVIAYAAEAAKVNRRSHYRWLQDPVYAEAFAQAEEVAGETLIAEARRRAVQGVAEPVYYLGKVVGSIQKYSDNLLMFLIKGHYPETYRENHHHEHTGSIDIVARIREGRDRLAKR